MVFFILKISSSAKQMRQQEKKYTPSQVKMSVL